MPKRKCNFTIELKREFPYLKDTGNGKVLRNHCGSLCSIVHGGRADVTITIYVAKSTKSLLKQLHPHFERLLFSKMLVPPPLLL